jgi:hypothetical protein
MQHICDANSKFHFFFQLFFSGVSFAQKLLVGCGGRKGCLGAVKSHVSKEWFLQQYEDKSLTKKVVVTNPFRVQLKTLTIHESKNHHLYW